MTYDVQRPSPDGKSAGRTFRRGSQLVATMSGIGLVGACSVLAPETEEQAAEGGLECDEMTILVAYGPGGGTDVGARILEPFVEEALDTQVNIVNREGGGGWVGWGELAAADPDGCTVGFINVPDLITGYLNPELNNDRSLEDFQLIANQVSDFGAIAVNAGTSEFTDIEALIDHAKTTPTTVTALGVGSGEHFAVLELNETFGTQFEAVHFEGAAEALAAVRGGHVDVFIGNVSEVAGLHDSGDLVALSVMKDSDEPVEFLPDVPTLSAAGFPGVSQQSVRGIAGPAGIPDEALDDLVVGFAEAIENTEHQEELAKQDLVVEYAGPDDYLELLQEIEKTAQSLGDKHVW